MKHLTFSVIGSELFCTYDDGNIRAFRRVVAGEDFILDCACLMESLYDEVEKKLKAKEGA